MTASEPSTNELLSRVAELEHRLGTMEDAMAIERLQFQYGYYLDKTYYDQVVDLFAEEGARVHFLHGVWEGKEGARRLYSGRFKNIFADGQNGPQWGRLLDHPQLQPIITVSEDRMTAHGRFRSVMQAGTHISLPAPRQWWEGGIYENTYVRENGVWKIKVLNWRPVWRADFHKGWIYEDQYAGFMTVPYPEDPAGPDEIRPTWQMFPDTETVPFHYRHPMTGEEVG